MYSEFCSCLSPHHMHTCCTQTSHSPALPHPGFFIQRGEEEEEEEVEFMDNNAYESVTPEPVRRQLPSQPPQWEFETSSLQQGLGGSPKFGSRELSPSLISGPPRFEIASQERGLVFETVKIRNQK